MKYYPAFFVCLYAGYCFVLVSLFLFVKSGQKTDDNALHQPAQQLSACQAFPFTGERDLHSHGVKIVEIIITVKMDSIPLI